MSRYLNSYYSTLQPYVPGELPERSGVIKLNTNENPYPPSPGVIAAFTQENAKTMRLYSDPNSRELNRAIAGACGVRPENVMSTGGSDETIELAFMAYGEDGIAYPDETYGFYPVYSALHHIDAKVIPVKEDFSIDPDDYKNLGRAVIFANPNAPTGLYLDRIAVEEIVRSNPDHVVIVDEAYVDFGNESMIPLTQKYDNLLVIQTFSKSRSLAGARIGFAVGNAALIRDLETLRNSRNPYDISRISQIIGVKAIEEAFYYRGTCETIVRTREWFKRQLKELGFHFPDSHANFVFAEHKTIGGQELADRLKERNILIRHFTKPRIANYNRITIGTEEDMKTVAAVLKEIVYE